MSSLELDQWLRKRRSNLRNHHTASYQRETWGNVFNCFKDEGLHVKGDISKPVLKERFKTLNTIFEDIYRIQSAWIVADEQLQLELIVSVEAVVWPAYDVTGNQANNTGLSGMLINIKRGKSVKKIK
ncbi:hypothetical protein ZOSMA_224G00350 [Zostera marina]|uniref:Exocyst subunit Exo70 family protein n=1 Tax=Zostera marina TaxID=29655 RepID=A0A0K9PIU1_ZOSMR|nr:hypothetical protein ZOSMA_224G00350 [Zostera marina]